MPLSLAHPLLPCFPPSASEAILFLGFLPNLPASIHSSRPLPCLLPPSGAPHTLSYFLSLPLSPAQEFISLAGLQHLRDEEFSEAGRAVYPDGLLRLLLSFHRRYARQHPRLHYIVTENGFADRDDVIRPAYMVEHLLAVHAAIQQVGYRGWSCKAFLPDVPPPVRMLCQIFRTDEITHYIRRCGTHLPRYEKQGHRIHRTQSRACGHPTRESRLKRQHA